MERERDRERENESDREIVTFLIKLLKNKNAEY